MLRPPTADYGTTLCIALVSFVMIQYASIRYQKWGAFKSLFDPIFLFFPINVISEFATPVSLSLRLFGNILAGKSGSQLFQHTPDLKYILHILFGHAGYFCAFSRNCPCQTFLFQHTYCLTDRRSADAKL